MTALELAGKIVSCIDAKKGEDIKLLDVHDRTTLCDYFVIASGSSTPQLRAMADEIDEKLSELGIDARRREGWETADWLLLDYEIRFCRSGKEMAGHLGKGKYLCRLQ